MCYEWYCDSFCHAAIAGFYPDSGGSYFLSRLEGALGTYLGLTCAQVKGENTYNIGLATHYTTSADGSVSIDLIGW